MLIHKLADGTEKALPLSGKPLIIGRLPESEIQVRDSFISRVHAGISHANDQFLLKDFGSTNGTYRNGARVFECALASGDKIQVGNATLLFELDAATGNATLQHVQAPPPARAIGPGVAAASPQNEGKMTVAVKPLPPIPRPGSAATP